MDLLHELVPRLLAAPDTSEEYFAIRFVGRSDGVVERSCQSHWDGFEGGDIRREIRKASRMDAGEAEDYRAGLAKLGEDCLLIRTLEDLRLFALAGGNALIECVFAESRTELADLLGPRVCVQTGLYGFTALKSLPETATNRAPTPKQRMSVLKRDEFRCRICGRRAVDNVDVQLHVHHIRPWAIGGVTVNENMITLCHTCHTGLDPHAEWRLFDLLDPSKSHVDQRQYREGLEEYWRIAVDALQRLQASDRAGRPYGKRLRQPHGSRRGARG